VRDLDPPVTAIRDIVTRALAEDLGILGDLTSIALVPEGTTGAGQLVTRAEGIVAGTACVTEVFAQLDPQVRVTWRCVDGEEIERDQVLARVEGQLRSILTGERTALNLLCHLSGVATLTRRFVRTARGQVRIRDTRKTLPGLRALEKAAVRAGGGFNHRDGLSDAVLIKDNHLRQMPISQAVKRAQLRWPGRIIELECDTLDQVAEARDAGVDLVLLDNMAPAEVSQAVKLLDGAAKVEVSGGVTLSNIAAYADAGADLISIGAITHSAPALDVGLDIED
jgi:nicotinate-nucleotide pyrophosphorylase (carboxylating)